MESGEDYIRGGRIVGDYLQSAETFAYAFRLGHVEFHFFLADRIYYHFLAFPETERALNVREELPDELFRKPERH